MDVLNIMYVVFVLTNLIFNYTFLCCLAGLRVGEGRKKKKKPGKTSVVFHEKRQPGSVDPPFADTAVTAHRRQSLAGIWYRATLDDLHFQALTQAENER